MLHTSQAATLSKHSTRCVCNIHMMPVAAAARHTPRHASICQAIQPVHNKTCVHLPARVNPVRRPSMMCQATSRQAAAVLPPPLQKLPRPHLVHIADLATLLVQHSMTRTALLPAPKARQQAAYNDASNTLGVAAAVYTAAASKKAAPAPLRRQEGHKAGKAPTTHCCSNTQL